MSPKILESFWRHSQSGVFPHPVLSSFSANKTQNLNNKNDLGDGSTLNNEEAIATTPNELGCNNHESMAETQKTRTLTEYVLGLGSITVGGSSRNIF